MTVAGGCRDEAPSEPQPIYLADLADENPAAFEQVQISSDFRSSQLVSAVTLGADTRRTLGPPLTSRLEFDVDVPQNPVLRFSIAAHAFEAEILPDPVVFRVRVETTGADEEIWSETLGRVQASTWVDHEVDLARWSEASVRIVLETERGKRRVENSSEAPIVPLWANPVVTNKQATYERPNIILISIDCLRPDHLSAYGYSRNTSPNIDRLAADGVVFEQVVGGSSWTHPTHMTMLTGLPPSIHGATRWSKLDPSVAFLPDTLTQAGYRADGVVTVDYLSQSFGLERGFHTYRYDYDMGATAVVDEAIGLVRRAQGESHFLFMHMLDAHWRYAPPRGFRDRFGERPEDIEELNRIVGSDEPPVDQGTIDDVMKLYDGEVAHVDTELGRLFDELDRLGLYEKSLIIFTGDHGEAFYEHEWWKHTQTLYDEMVRIPLIVKWPGNSPTGRVQTMVSQTDVVSIAMSAASLPSGNAWSRDLREELETPSVPGERTVVSEVFWEARQDVREATMKVALRTDAFKYIATLRGEPAETLSLTEPPHEELYDLVADPGELEDLSTAREPEMREFRKKLRAYFDEVTRLRATRSGEEVVLDEAALERLRALGYVEG